jgi:hypothetical protein
MRPALRLLLVLCPAVLLAAATTFPSASANQASSLNALWRTGEVVIDGSLADWPELTRVGNGPVVAAQNDASHLYVAVASNDPTVRVQLATGLIVWLDRTNRRQQTFGLRLEGLAPRPLEGTTPTATADRLPERIQNSLDRFDLLGPARLQRRLIDDTEGLGFELASGVENDTIVYEMKIPLGKSDKTPHAVDAAPGATIALGIETPPDLPQARNRRRLDEPMMTRPWVDPWGYGGYFTTPPPPPGGRPREPEPLRPLRLSWATVRLASTP